MSSIRITTDIRGAEGVVAALLRANKELRAGFLGETRKFLMHVLGRAIVDAPVDEGTLRGSGSAHLEGKRVASSADFGHSHGTPLGGGSRLTARQKNELIGAIVFNTVYASYQHERTDLAHPKGGKAKYLEDAVRSSESLFRERLAGAVRGRLR